MNELTIVCDVDDVSIWVSRDRRVGQSRRGKGAFALDTVTVI